jgi:hypothetical protein
MNLAAGGANYGFKNFTGLLGHVVRKEALHMNAEIWATKEKCRH